MSNYPKPQHLPLELQDISTGAAIFIAVKQEKTNMKVIQICIIISFTLNYCQKYKKSNRNHHILS